MLSMLTRSKSSAVRLVRLGSLAAELRAARLAEEKAHAAYAAEADAVRQAIADRPSPPFDPSAVAADFVRRSDALDSLAEAARRSSQARREAMLRLESAALEC